MSEPYSLLPDPFSLPNGSVGTRSRTLSYIYKCDRHALGRNRVSLCLRVILGLGEEGPAPRIRHSHARAPREKRSSPPASRDLLSIRLPGRTGRRGPQLLERSKAIPASRSIALLRLLTTSETQCPSGSHFPLSIPAVPTRLGRPVPRGSHVGPVLVSPAPRSCVHLLRRRRWCARWTEL